jgi:phosphopantetheinyl transferase
MPLNNPLIIDAWSLDLDRMDVPDCLDREEYARVVNFDNPLMRSRFTRTRSLVRHALGARLGCPPAQLRFQIAPGGKPQISGFSNQFFSISHSQNLLIVALANEEIGVDFETPRDSKQALTLAKRFFSTADYEFLLSIEPTGLEAAFLRQWVAKEAALKASGCGISEALRTAECRYGADGITTVVWEGGRAGIEPFEAIDGTGTGAFAWLSENPAVIRWHDAEELGNPTTY